MPNAKAKKYLNCEKYKLIQTDLLGQLERNGTVGAHYIDLIEDYINFWVDKCLLLFICKLDSKGEVDDPKNWPKANPSLPYLPDLQEEIRKEYAEWKKNPAQLPAFMTKRMNLPQSDREIAVTERENLEATNRIMPDLTGWSCVAVIDYASLGDWASVVLHFRRGNRRFDLSHSWLCLKSKDLERLKIDWRDWERRGFLTVVDDVEIAPELVPETQIKYRDRFMGVG